MKEFSRTPEHILETEFHPVYVFTNSAEDQNIDPVVVKSFGDEWSKFNSFTDKEIEKLGQSYFDILDNQIINAESYMIDFGGGSGRFSKYLASRVKFIDVLEPSNAVYAANNTLRSEKNIRISKASIGSSPYQDGAYDFAMSIGVLHHMPDTKEGMQQCIRKVKPGGWFYVYLYYSLDNRGLLFKGLFQLVNVLRKVISRLPYAIKHITCDIIAITFYMPVIILGRFFRSMGLRSFARKIPLNYYQDQTFHIIRNDALDRFGTKLEQRFSKSEIETMMTESGLANIRISGQEPFWHAVGQKFN